MEVRDALRFPMIRSSLIAVLVLSCSHAALAQGTASETYPRTEVFGGISVNTDNIPNRPVLVSRIGRCRSPSVSEAGRWGLKRA